MTQKFHRACYHPLSFNLNYLLFWCLFFFNAVLRFIYNINNVVKDAWYDRITQDREPENYLDWMVYNNSGTNTNDTIYAAISDALNGQLDLNGNIYTNQIVNSFIITSTSSNSFPFAIFNKGHTLKYYDGIYYSTSFADYATFSPYFNSSNINTNHS